MVRLVPVLGVLLVCAATARALEPVSFDRFLAGIESCKPSAAFDAYNNSLGKKYGNDFGTTRARVRDGVRLAIPAEVAAGIGAPVSANKKDFTYLTIPASGTYRGLRVSGFEFSLGNENGISLAGVVFDAPLAEVRRAFGAAATRANSAGAKEEFAQYTVSFGKGPKGRVICDRST